MKTLRKWWFWVLIIIIIIFVIVIYSNDEKCSTENSEYCDVSCETDEDCKFVCGCGFINVDEECKMDVMVACEYWPILPRCINGECINDDNPRLDCAGSCRCMEKCNEQGPVYFIFNEEASQEECYFNLENKMCCCSGI